MEIPTPAALAPQGGGEQSEARAFPPWTGRKRIGMPAEGKVLQGLFFLKLKGRPRWGGRVSICAKTSCAPAFVCVRGAPVAHEVLFLFNTHCIRLCPAAEKLQISCRAGRVCPLLCPPVKAQSDEKPVSHRPVFSVSPPFPPGFFLHLFDIIHPSQRLYRELFTLSTGFSTPSPP